MPLSARENINIVKVSRCINASLIETTRWSVAPNPAHVMHSGTLNTSIALPDLERM